MVNAGQYTGTAAKHEKLAGSYLTFRSMEDARQFIRNLFNGGVLLAPDIPDEFRYAILLLMLVPASPGELITARWSDIYSNDYLHRLLTIKAKRRGSFGNDEIAFLSSTVRVVIDRLKGLTGFDEFLFPQLCKLGKKDLEKELGLVIARHWENYRIDQNGFVNLFRTMAVKHSNINKEFIDSMLKRDHGVGSAIINQSNTALRNHLFDWWGNELCSPTYLTFPNAINTNLYFSSNTPPMHSGLDGGKPDNQQFTSIPDPLSKSYTESNIMEWFYMDQLEVKNAKEYYSSTKIIEIQPNSIIGQIFGQTFDGFRVEILFFFDQNHKLCIESRCTCRNQRCAHGAIVLLYALDKRQGI
jgi:hypothetical protein